MDPAPEKETTEWQAYTIRFPMQVFQELKTLHAATYVVHRLSFNAWLLERLKFPVTGDER